MPQPPTHANIATAVGVSRATVSRALSNPGSVNAATREKILAAAANLGYRPDPFVTANMLRVRSSGAIRAKATIAYLTPCALTRYVKGARSYQQRYDSACQRAHELGFELDPISLGEENLSAKRCTDIMLARGVQGVIIAPFYNPFIRLHLDWSQFAAATIGFTHVQPKFSSATPNYYQIMSLAIRRMRHLGYRRIGLALPAQADRYTQGMFGAVYCRYADTQPLCDRIPRLTPPLKDWNEGALIAWYRQYKPEAIICVTQDVKHWLKAAQVRFPDDVGIVMLGWQKTDEGFAGINQHNELVGGAAVQLVVDSLQFNERGAPAFPKSILIDGEWITGESIRRMRR